MQKRIAKDVQRLRKDGVNYSGINASIRKKYGIDLSSDDVDTYAHMKVQTYRVPLIAGAVILTGFLVMGGIVYAFSRNGKMEPVQQQTVATQQSQANPESLFAPYILVKMERDPFTNKFEYVIDFDKDKKPDGIITDGALKVAALIMKAGVNINAESLLRSLYDIHADDFIIQSTEQIIARKGKPPQFTVYQISNNTLAINTEVNDAWQQINKHILDSLMSNASAEQKRQSIESALRGNPEAASATLGALGGADFGKYLQQQGASLTITNYYSELARGNFSAAVGSLATGNVAGVIGNLFAAWFTEQAAKATIQGLEGSKSGEGSSESCPGIPGRGFYIITDPKAGVSYHFTDCAEAQQKLREIQSR